MKRLRNHYVIRKRMAVPDGALNISVSQYPFVIADVLTAYCHTVDTAGP